MAKVSVTKEFTWDMAHMLADHKGLCRNLHGHTYKMQVEVVRKAEDLITGTGHSDGMVIDFKDLKSIVQEKIIGPLDHALMYWGESSDPVEHEIAELLEKSGRKVVKVNYRPTAEGMCIGFHNILSKEFDNIGINIVSIKIWETPTSFAEAR